MLLEKIKEVIGQYDKKKLFITGFIVMALVYRLVFVGGIGLFDHKYELEDTSQGKESQFVDNGAKDGEIMASDTLDKKDARPHKIKVYITGAVANPGVISLDSDKRLDDAIRMAGGLLEKADANRINMAMNLEDSQHYIIPYIGQDDAAVNNQATNQNVAGASPAGGQTGGQATGNNAGAKININTADQSKLEDIPGVGPATAKKIMDYRQKSGGFKSIEDIKNVTGIGDKKFENMKDSIDVK